MSIVSIDSEIGRLEGVILLNPGNEVERMTPDNAKAALYGDILNKEILQEEYGLFRSVLAEWTKVYEVHKLLEESIKNNNDFRFELIEQSCQIDNCLFIIEELKLLTPDKLAEVLIEGYEYNPRTHPNEYKTERFCLKPLYNFFFTRDTSSVLFDTVCINPMASKPRYRERLIMDFIFRHYFKTSVFSPLDFDNSAITEGGDILVIRHDTLCIGKGKRTNEKGILSIAEHIRKTKNVFNIIVQELPDKESFIHLDMVFTFLDKNICMVYAPLIEKLPVFNNYQTTHIRVENGKISYHSRNNLLEALKLLKFDMNPIYCGGQDSWSQDREQWHSGANFFALGEGKIIGYERNRYTIEALSNAGFEILPANEFSSDKLNNTSSSIVVTLKASELPRGGGGARCMTLPVKRSAVQW